MPRYLVRHHGAWRYQRAVPADLQPLEGRAVCSLYLGPISKEKAQTRAFDLAADQNRRAEALRQLSEPDKQLLIAKGGLARCESDAAYARYLAATLWAHSEPDANGRPTTNVEAVREATQQAVQRGVYVETIIPKPVTRDRDPKLFDLIPQWSKGIKVKEVRKMQQRVRHFAETIGDIEATDVTRAHTTKWRDSLYELKNWRNGEPCKLSTCRKYIDSLHALFAAALSAGTVDSNPFSGLKLADRASGQKFHTRESRKPFSADQLAMILKRSDELNPDDAMVFKLLIYSGARSGELCQLRACDIRKVDGIPVMEITDEAEGGSLKNKQSLRTVPLHKAIANTMLRHAAKIAKEKGPDGFLFNYSWRPSDQTYGGLFQQRAHRWLREKICITDPNLTLHSTRHRFEDACHDAGLPEYITNRLVGHVKQKGTGARYGKGASVRVMAKWIAKVDPLKE